MNLEVDVERLMLAHKEVRAELLAERKASGHWVGRLGSSPFATAAAVSALVAAHRRNSTRALQESGKGDRQIIEHVVQGDLSELLVASVQWIALHQNPDGGWGDCVGAKSNIAATLMVQAAFRLTGIPAKFADLMARADDYVTAAGGVAGLRRRCDRDKSLYAAIMANCALAGMVAWRQVPALQFEVACLPKRWQRDLQLFGARQALPVVLAVGRAKFHHNSPMNPISLLIRRSLRAQSLVVLESLQAADDSFLGSTPLTAFVVMSLSSIGCQDHPIVRRGIEFLLTTVRADSSWAITPNLAIANTALAINSLLTPAPGGRSPEFASHEVSHFADDDDGMPVDENGWSWLLDCQRPAPDAITEVPEGGWATGDSAGALPNTIATAQVLLALSKSHGHVSNDLLDRLERVAGRGIAWLLNLENDDGSWPTFYRDESLPRFESCRVDATAHVLQSLAAWRRCWNTSFRVVGSHRPFGIDERIAQTIERGWRYLVSQQQADGSFTPLWFGNEHHPDEHNPVYGTAQVLMASAELDRLDSDVAQRAARWLVSAQHANGGWGPPRVPVDYSGAERDGLRPWRDNEALAQLCSVEETSLAIHSLLPLADNADIAQSVSRGLTWLVQAIEQDRHRRPAIIGFTMSKLWYDERLYPLAFAAGALSRTVERVAAAAPAASHVG